MLRVPFLHVPIKVNVVQKFQVLFLHDSFLLFTDPPSYLRIVLVELRNFSWSVVLVFAYNEFSLHFHPVLGLGLSLCKCLSSNTYRPEQFGLVLWELICSNHNPLFLDPVCELVEIFFVFIFLMIAIDIDRATMLLFVGKQLSVHLNPMAQSLFFAPCTPWKIDWVQ